MVITPRRPDLALVILYNRYLNLYLLLKHIYLSFFNLKEQTIKSDSIILSFINIEEITCNCLIRFTINSDYYCPRTFICFHSKGKNKTYYPLNIQYEHKGSGINTLSYYA